MLSVVGFAINPMRSSSTMQTVNTRRMPCFEATRFSGVVLRGRGLVGGFTGYSRSGHIIFVAYSNDNNVRTTVVGYLAGRSGTLIVGNKDFNRHFIRLLALRGVPFARVGLRRKGTLGPRRLTGCRNGNCAAFLVRGRRASAKIRCSVGLMNSFYGRGEYFLVISAVDAFLYSSFSVRGYNTNIVIANSRGTLTYTPNVTMVILTPSTVRHVRGDGYYYRCLSLGLTLGGVREKRAP